MRPPRAATMRVPHLANTSWPWWLWPARPEPNSRARAAEVVAAAHGEDVVVEVERVALDVAGLRVARLGAVRAGRGEPERVAARLGGRAAEAAVPRDALDLVGGHLLRRPGLHRRAVERAHELHLERGGRRAREPEREGHARPGADERLRAARAGLEPRRAVHPRAGHRRQLGVRLRRQRREDQDRLRGRGAPAGGGGERDRPGDRADRHARVEAACCCPARTFTVASSPLP